MLRSSKRNKTILTDVKMTDVRKGVTKRTAVLKNRRVTISDKFLLEYHAKPMGYQRREFDSITNRDVATTVKNLFQALESMLIELCATKTYEEKSA